MREYPIDHREAAVASTDSHRSVGQVYVFLIELARRKKTAVQTMPQIASPAVTEARH